MVLRFKGEMTEEQMIKELKDLREYCVDTFIGKEKDPYVVAIDKALDLLKVR